MSDEVSTVFRSHIEVPVVSQEMGKPVKLTTDGQTGIEPPYLDYESVNGHPYLVDHFQLGDSWKDKLGGFEREINILEEYVKGKIQEGKTANSLEAVKEMIERIEKVCLADKTERATMKIEKMAAYVEFLAKTDKISYNNYKLSSNNYKHGNR